MPNTFVQAIKLMVAAWYENREDTQIGSGLVVASLPLGAQALLNGQRILTVGYV